MMAQEQNPNTNTPADTDARQARFRAYCTHCSWTFTVRAKALAERLRRMHAAENTGHVAKVGETRTAVAPPTPAIESENENDPSDSECHDATTDADQEDELSHD